MGFFKKLWNFVTGKGFKEEEIKDDIQEAYKEDINKKLRDAEDIKPIEREEIKEDIEIRSEPRRRIVKEDRFVSQANEDLVKAKDRFVKSGKISQLQDRLVEGTISETEFTPTDDLGMLNGIYNNLLQKSTISTVDRKGNLDQALIDVLIENRGKLQHRFTAEIIIYTTSGQGSMAIDGILAEHMSSIYDFIQVGATYTSEELKSAMNQALRFFEKQYGSIGGSINPPLETKSTVQDVQIKMTFA